jgi:hypothetical protein
VAIGPLRKSTERLKSLDRIEELRVGIAHNSTPKYVRELMTHYTKQSMHPKAMELARPKSVTTEDAFSFLRGAF